MKVKLKKLGMQALLATAFFASATASQAGTFVPLTNGVGGVLSTANGGIITGATNSNADRLFIETTSASYVSGLDPDNASGEVVASSLTYRAFTGATTITTGTLSLLDWRVTRDVALGEPGQFDYFDFVYRDSADNKLVFGTRALNQLDNNEEVNFLYRYGFTGFETASAWTFSTDLDLRQYQAARTDSLDTSTTDLPFDEDAVRQRSDVSLSEGNPWTGLFLVKTDATDYDLGAKAIGFGQAGEEGQEVVRGYIGGYVPIATTTPVPVPGAFVLIASGLGFLGFSARRGNKA